MSGGQIRRSLSPLGRVVSGYDGEVRGALRGARWGHPLEVHAQIGSTNLRAKAWAREGAPAGALVVADEQTEGRGRFGRTWHAPPGAAILATVVVRPRLEAERLPLITLAWAVGIREVLVEAGARTVAVKWPNDLMADEKKIAGILTESVLGGGGLEAAVIGFGVNINQEAVPTPRGTSLQEKTGRTFARGPLLARIVEAGRLRLEELERDGPEVVLDVARRYSATLGREVTLALGESRIHGRAVDIDSSGRLVLETAEGLHRASAGEVTTREANA